jgi:predicted nicotinamide N-methyase
MEEVIEGEIYPLFGTNVLTNGYFTVPGTGTKIVCGTRRCRRNDMLFADDVWPGSRCLVDYLIMFPDTFRSRYVLELGAGAALPSLVAAALGAKRCVITDYPGDDIIENIEALIESNNLSNAVALGHVWGREDARSLLQYGRISESGELLGYDLILMAELLWKDTYKCHRQLLESLSACLSRDGVAYCCFAHRPTEVVAPVDNNSNGIGADPSSTAGCADAGPITRHTAENDLEFFALAETEYNICCKKITLETGNRYADVGDCGDGSIEVHLYEMRFK